MIMSNFKHKYKIEIEFSSNHEQKIIKDVIETRLEDAIWDGKINKNYKLIVNEELN